MSTYYHDGAEPQRRSFVDDSSFQWAYSHITTPNDKSRSRHGSVQNLALPFNIFAMAKVVMVVPNKRY